MPNDLALPGKPGGSTGGRGTTDMASNLLLSLELMIGRTWLK